MSARSSGDRSPPRPGSIFTTHRATSLWLALALSIVTAAVYAPVRHYDFVNIDDPVYVRDNPHVNQGLTRESFVWAWTGVHGAEWHPLTSLSHMLVCQLFGLNPGPHHLLNLALHVLSTLLLFVVLADMTAQLWPSAVVAALFALHPAHVESVAMIAQRKDGLSACFWMLTLWAYVGYVRRPAAWPYARLLGAYVAAVLSKPIVVTLPFVLLLLDVWPLRRIVWEGRDARRCLWPRGLVARPAWSTLLIEKMPLFLLAGGLSVVTYLAQRSWGTFNPQLTAPLADRIANTPVSYVAYLGELLYPINLCVFYPLEVALPIAQVAAAALLLVGLTALVVWGAPRHPYLLTGWLWYLGTLAPVIGLLQFNGSAIADRYTYFPSIGVFIIAAWGLPDLLDRRRYRQVACSAAAILALAACTVLTARQLTYWVGTIPLLEHAAAVTRDNLLAHSVLGTLAMADGRHDEALARLSEAARICDTTRSGPTICAQAHYNTGVMLAKRGDLDGAQRHYRATLRFDPAYANAYIALGRTQAAQNDLPGAVASYREAIRLDPHLASAQTNLAIALETLGQTNEAIEHYAEGARLEPENAAFRCNWAAALTSGGRLPEAIEQFRAALQLQPHLVEARFGLASAYAQAGQAQAAIAEFDTVLREHAGATAVEVALAWLLATTGDPELRDGARAVQLAEAAAGRTGHHDPEVLNSLAAAYAEVGRFADAVQTSEAALDLARAKGQMALAAAVTQRLGLYRSGQPVRDRPGAQQP